MKLIRGLHNWPNHTQRCALTIGNFDGVHLGHQALLAHLCQQAAARQLASVLVVMEPQPQEFFQKNQAQARLTTLREKWQALANTGLDNVLCLAFNQELANMTALDFMRNVLLERLHMAYILVGDDFHFGQNRQGDAQLLRRYATEYDYEVEHVDSICSGTLRVSSTAIRAALAQGDLVQAKQLLGRDYSMCGRVAEGDQRGRQWGIPTANIYLQRQVSPISGVFVVEIDGLSPEPLRGVANIGQRPTVDGTRSLLEVHIFDFERSIYGRQLQVRFLHKLRDEQRFASVDQLKQQIYHDVEQAKHYYE